VFRIIVKVPEFGSRKNVASEVTLQVTPQVRRLITVVNVEMKRAEMMEGLDLKDRMHFTNEYMQPALDDELLEVTTPDKPRSSKQKHRLTDAEKRLLKSMQE
jgi:ATP-dependent DNA helicase RecG